MRKYLIWIIPLILIVSGILQFACSSGGGTTTPDVTFDAKYPPRNFEWEEGNRLITIGWESVPFAIGYRVYLCENGVDFYLYAGSTPISQNQIMITGLSNGRSYYVGVAAVGSTLKETMRTYPGGAPTAQPLIPTSEIPDIYIGVPPAPPANLQGYSGDRLVRLEWDHNTEPDFDVYKVYRARVYSSGPGLYSAFPAITDNYYDDDDVINSTMYHYYVTATDNEPIPLESGPSNIVKYKPMSSPPLKPINFTATFVGFKGIVLEWEQTSEQDIRAYFLIRYDWTNGYVDPLLDTVVVTLQYPNDPFVGTYPPIADDIIEPEHIYEYRLAAIDVDGQYGPAAVSEKVQVP